MKRSIVFLAACASLALAAPSNLNSALIQAPTLTTRQAGGKKPFVQFDRKACSSEKDDLRSERCAGTSRYCASGFYQKFNEPFKNEQECLNSRQSGPQRTVTAPPLLHSPAPEADDTKQQAENGRDAQLPNPNGQNIQPPAAQGESRPKDPRARQKELCDRINRPDCNARASECAFQQSKKPLNRDFEETWAAIESCVNDFFGV